MADMIQTGVAWLAGQLQQHVSQSVVYSEGAQSVPLLATIGNTLFEAADGAGGVTPFTSIDFLVLSSALILAGRVCVPKQGAKVTWGAKTFEVLPAPGGREYQPVLQFEMLRIHTKQVE